MTRHRIEVAGDFLERLAASPTRGLAELIWNALDADATNVHATFQRNAIGGIETVSVVDDGHGMTHAQAVAAFGALGGSWKRLERRSKTLGRTLHGSAGRGRFRAFGLGGVVIRWETIAPVDDSAQRMLTVVTLNREVLSEYEVADAVLTERPTGTTAVVEGISDTPQGLESDSGRTRLTAEFAVYLERYKPTVVLDGEALDPVPLQDERVEYELPTPSEVHGPATLIVVEWRIPVDRVIYLCDTEGVALDEVKASVHAPDFAFTAYLKWRGFEELSSDLVLADAGHPVLSPVVDSARAKLREHFAGRAAKKARGVIGEWRDAQVYPYPSAPASPLEEAEQRVFEVVAVAAAPAVNASGDPQSRRLTLRLLRETLQRGPSALQEVLDEVLHLPPDRIEELRHLLRRTSLAAIISASRVVADRLDFLQALRVLVFDPKTSQEVRERSQLHRMLEGETWVFGEEFNLSVSDRSLTAVLKQHLSLLGRTELAVESEVLDASGRRRIVDLMLARTVPQSHDSHEHLVVELKAPSVLSWRYARNISRGMPGSGRRSSPTRRGGGSRSR